VQRGDLIAYVNNTSDARVRLVLHQDAEERVRNSSTRIEIRPADDLSQVIEAHIAHEVPAATDKLPSVSLSLQGGGTIGIDPGSQGDVRAIERLFIMDLDLPPGTHLSNLGSRIYVRFTHHPEPLAQQWYRGFRRLLLNRFNV
jgi:putative peptide zinc metalloprotease protein